MDPHWRRALCFPLLLVLGCGAGSASSSDGSTPEADERDTSSLEVSEATDAIDAEIELRRQDPKRVASLKSGNIDYEDFREDLRSISKNR